jgi:hypothetical protein
MSEPFHPVSIGSTCEPKYQLSRHVFFRLSPRSTQGEFERALFRAEPPLFPRHLFDWQIIGLGGLIDLLADDFAHVFDRDDLEPSDASGRVLNRRVGAYYPHDFPPPKALTDADIDAGFGEARKRIETGVARFREHLHAPGPFLYVHRRTDWFDPEPAPREQLHRLLELLRARSPEHRCELLYAEEGDPGDDWSEPAAGLHRRAVRRTERPAEDFWKGDDASWDRALADFPLTLHNVIRRPRGAV